MTSIHNLPDELTLHFIAKSHTAVTANALRHVDVDIWMRVVNKGSFIYVLEVALFYPLLNCVTIKELVLRVWKYVGGLVLGPHLQYHAPLVLDHWIVS